MSNQTLAVVVGVVIFLTGMVGAMLVRCPSTAQAFAIIVALALGSGILLFGFLRQFQLSTTISGITASGAGAAFLVIFLVRPTVLADIACTSYDMPLRVLNAARATEPVPGAVVHVRGRTTERIIMNALGEGRHVFTEEDVGQDVRVWASASGYAEAEQTMHTLARQMGVTEIQVRRAVAMAPKKDITVSYTPGNEKKSDIKPKGVSEATTIAIFQNVFARRAAKEDVSRVFSSRFCKIGTVLNELRDCSYGAIDTCAMELSALEPGPYKSNHKCSERPDEIFCYAQQTKGFSGTGRPLCYPELASCVSSVESLARMSGASQPAGGEVCQSFKP